ncbi:MAG TPA: hypothetical protein VG345_16505 [Bryobacteraceae bacterium]|jgi:hypothetical protein|nr:hypothetical protein [Bryobacteraceae bacterium]
MKEPAIEEIRQRLKKLELQFPRRRRSNARQARKKISLAPLRVVSRRDIETEDILGALVPAGPHELYDFATSLADKFETITPREAERRNRVLAEMQCSKRWMFLTRDRILYGLERACSDARKYFPAEVIG